MARDDDLPKRIEAVFERTGLGNLDPEKLEEFVETYDRTMATAARLRAKKGRNFEEILAETPEKPPEE